MEKKATKKKEQAAKKFEWKKIGYSALLVAWVGIACISAQIIIGIPMIWILGKAKFGQPVWTTIYTALVYAMAAALIIFIPKLIKKAWKTSREKLGLKELPTFTDIGIGIIGFIATIVVAGIVLTFLDTLHLIDTGQAQNTGFSGLYSPFDRVVAFLSLAVFAPVAEEIIFRGWLYDKLKKHGCAASAIILTSLLFATLHGQWNVGITVGIMSVVMCIERELTGTIYAGIITHMLKNGIAFWLMYIVMGM
jgi:membrane protease YdiL (CAAX protease family)